MKRQHLLKIMGYVPKNESDRDKINILTTTAGNLSIDTYVDLYAGMGEYEIDGEGKWEGTAIVVPRTIHCKPTPFGPPQRTAFLHEKDSKKRKTLEKNIEKLRKELDSDLITEQITLHVRGKWQKSIDRYIAEADESWLFSIDPTYSEDYIQNDGIIAYLDSICRTGANIYIYLPQSLELKEFKLVRDRKIFDKINEILLQTKREAIDIHKIIRNLKRIDHHIIVTKQRGIRSLLEQAHTRDFEKRSAMNLPFRQKYSIPDTTPKINQS